MWLSGSKFQALGLIPTPHKMDTVVHACNPNTWDVEAGGQEVQGHPQLHS